jgi:hypothetical protein
MAGVAILTLPLADMLDVAYHLMIEDAVPHTSVQVDDEHVEMRNRGWAKSRIEEHLDGSTPPEGIAAADPETWGTDRQHQQALAAQMAEFGPMTGGHA